MSSISSADLVEALTGDPGALDVHLSLIERDVVIDGCSVRIHCHCLAVDSNGRVQPHRLAEFMRNAVADYAIPRSKLAAARARDRKFNSSEAVAGLVEQARRSFTDLAKTGEGGEMLLFLLAERFLKYPQVLCKMHLKTDAQMHYHGADGIYAQVGSDGLLKLYWGESKIYKNPGEAIKECLASLAPFLIESDSEDAERERDLVLLSDNVDLGDPGLNKIIMGFFDRNSPMSKKVKYCGLALVGFDAQFYPGADDQAVADDISQAARVELDTWVSRIDGRLKAERLEQFEIDFLCLPLPSAEGFRSAFLKAMGLAE